MSRNEKDPGLYSAQDFERVTADWRVKPHVADFCSDTAGVNAITEPPRARAGEQLPLSAHFSADSV